MIRLQESGDAQTVKFVPREHYAGAGTAYFIDITSGEEFSYAVTISQDKHYDTFSVAMADLLEDHYYFVVIHNATEEIYRGMCFVTNQSAYNINQNVYTERSTTNGHIEYEG